MKGPEQLKFEAWIEKNRANGMTGFHVSASPRPGSTIEDVYRELNALNKAIDEGRTTLIESDEQMEASSGDKQSDIDVDAIVRSMSLDTP